MQRIQSTDDLQQYVRTVAQHRLERDPSSVEHVAQSVVSDMKLVGDEPTYNTVAEPYHENTVMPGDVIRYGSVPTEELSSLDWRSVAVATMAYMIREATAEYEADRADHERLAELEDRRERHFDRHGHF